MLLIEDFIDYDLCDRLCREIKSIPKRDGKKTARGMAKNQKHNLELDPEHGAHILRELQNLIFKHPRIGSYAFPSAISPIIINIFSAGMSYDNHIDSAVIGNVRTDISFTLFLEHPEKYTGGGLVIENPDLPFPVVKKPKRGSIFLYKTGPIHRVNEVTRGTRLACVGWLQSRIRDDARRSVLRELYHAGHIYYERCGHDNNAELFFKNITELERMWTD